MDAALARRVERQRVEMVYGNTLAVSGSALLMAAIVAVIAWPHSNRLSITSWCSAVVLVQVYVQWLAFRYRHATDRETASRAWGSRLAMTAGLAGVVWGAAAF